MTVSSASTPQKGCLRVYLVRHALPCLPDDTPRFIGGGFDPNLGREGIAQAERLGKRLGNVDFREVWSTGLARTTHTAAIVGRRPPEAVRVERDLREVEVGLWEGLSAQEAAARYPKEWAARELDILGFRFPAGESFRDLHGRAWPAFCAITSKAARGGAGDILIVAHKNVNRVLLCGSLALPQERMFDIPQDHCCLYVLRVEIRRGRLYIELEEGPDGQDSVLLPLSTRSGLPAGDRHPKASRSR